MKAEIITIGDEILIGQIVDSNSAWIAQQLNLLGVEVFQITSISDKKEHIISALKDAANRVDLVLLTGGLGPTKDDITKTTLCEFFNTELVFNEEAYQTIEKIFKIRDLIVGELNRKQAEIPANCSVIQNYQGTAPGMWFEKDDTVFVSMPGVPFEMKAMMEEEILLKLKERFHTPVMVYKTVLTIGIPESHLAERLEQWEEQLMENQIKLAYLPQPGIIRLRLSATGQTQEELEERIDKEIEKLKKIIPDNIFGYDDQKLEQIVGELLLKNNQTVATAESCTGGKIAHLITQIPGSSEYFKGSVVAYANEIKERVLGVNPVVLEQYGAVSQQVVEEMAKGVLLLNNVDYAIATSGVAGPTGGTDEKPVGTVWIAVASKDAVISEKFLLGTHRERNIHKSSIAGLNMMRKLISDKNN